MELYQEVATCLTCGTRLTVCGKRQPRAGQVTAYEVSCPVCWTAVPFAIPGQIDPANVCLICYERPPTVPSDVTLLRRRRPQAAGTARRSHGSTLDGGDTGPDQVADRGRE